MVKIAYIPERGDMVWLSFGPTLGHEQAGRRPALILSSRDYNKKTDMAICCPITQSIKGYSFEVEILIFERKCVVLADQIRALDLLERDCQFIGKVLDMQLLEVQDKVNELIKG
ncbi:MAG: endoribonuclease MazF [Candidatus Taylorbacteria bacterium]|nr:endoribonuclease MazF [Candidatus Taylorbacteria bacterium]